MSVASIAAAKRLDAVTAVLDEDRWTAQQQRQADGRAQLAAISSRWDAVVNFVEDNS